MTSNEILKADLLDILFDNRNKQYGAYTLRKTYNNRLGISLGLSLSTVLLVFFLMRIDGSSNAPATPQWHDEVVVDHVIPPDIKKPDPIVPKQTNLPQVKQTAFVDPVIKDDKSVKNPMPDQNDLIKSLISDQTKDGADPTDMPVINEPPVVNTPVKEEPKEVSTPAVQREPEFPGGQQAWLKFLQKNLVAPSDLEPGETKTVAIRFDVSEEGVVTNFHVIKSGGNIYDNEVIRVLKKMPKWKPAIQNGQAVARAFTQPVTFMGADQ